MTNWVLERLIEFKTAGSRWDPVVVYATQPVVVYATQADAERAKRCLPVGGSAQGGIIREFRVRELVD